MKRIRTVVAVALCSAAFVATAQTGAPNDAQIAAIVVTANQVDIEAGKLAEAKAASKDVKAFGKQMVTDHTGVNKSATDLAAKLKLKPEDNPTAQSLKKGGADNVAHLKTLKVSEPPKRSAGIKVPDVATLVAKLKNEAKVI